MYLIFIPVLKIYMKYIILNTISFQDKLNDFEFPVLQMRKFQVFLHLQ